MTHLQQSHSCGGGLLSWQPGIPAVFLPPSLTHTHDHEVIAVKLRKTKQWWWWTVKWKHRLGGVVAKHL